MFIHPNQPYCLWSFQVWKGSSLFQDYFPLGGNLKELINIENVLFGHKKVIIMLGRALKFGR
jgi:hypothetical protein